jgi:Excalibur calcium-binding domain
VKNILALAVIAALAWYGYGKFKTMSNPGAGTELSSAIAPSQVQQDATTPASSQFSCDGRTHCSAMTSCAEATYFIQHCPNTKMDGNNDGVPCEQQWCN